MILLACVPFLIHEISSFFCLMSCINIRASGPESACGWVCIYDYTELELKWRTKVLYLTWLGRTRIHTHTVTGSLSSMAWLSCRGLWVGTHTKAGINTVRQQNIGVNVNVHIVPSSNHYFEENIIPYPFCTKKHHNRNGIIWRKSVCCCLFTCSHILAKRLWPDQIDKGTLIPSSLEKRIISKSEREC